MVGGNIQLRGVSLVQGKGLRTLGVDLQLAGDQREEEFKINVGPDIIQEYVLMLFGHLPEQEIILGYLFVLGRDIDLGDDKLQGFAHQ